MASTKTPQFSLEEVLQQAARERDIDMERWISALEDAMASAAKKQHRVKVTWRPPEGKRTDTGTLERFIPAASESADNDSGGAHIEISLGPDDTRRIPLQSIDIARLVPEF